VAFILKLSLHEQRITPSHEGRVFGESTSLADLPELAAAQSAPLDAGQKLQQALGGTALIDSLTDDPDKLFLLDIPDLQADRLPREFAALPERQLMAHFEQLGARREVSRCRS